MVTQEFKSVCVTGGGGFPGGSDGKEPAPGSDSWVKNIP